ncbi:hypothetical protein DL764_008271 [Monosporascus ibericus]|uniref:Ketoreductase (KR) domain-containing protein n=1 Tax=Monosporascus ibericus TaxID=155417 RepID=A0A4Q4SXY3_9PEZI|nr:hypothetical protein DL764_008271 [Monosporascus ibericus]
MVFGIKSIPFNPNKDIRSLASKVILVTKGNSGLGKQSILKFSRHNPAQIWLGARDLQKAKAAADDIRRQVLSNSLRPRKLSILVAASFAD